MFARQMTVSLAQLSEAIESQAGQAVHELAHRLKGSAAIVGAARLAELFDAVCETTADGRTDGASLVQPQLVEAWNDTAEAMRGYVEQTDART